MCFIESVFFKILLITACMLMGAEVRWQEPEISIKLADTDIKLTLGSRPAVKNGQEIQKDTCPNGGNRCLFEPEIPE